MHYHPSLAIAYLTPPRTASRSIVAMLERHGFVSIGGRHAVLLDTLPQWERVIVTVRNHWDTLVSWWGYHQASPLWRWTMGFSEWLALFFSDAPVTHGAPQALPPRMWDPWRLKATHVVRFERLEEDLERCLPFRIGELAHIRDDWAKQPYRELYSDVEAERVAGAYRDEIRELGYT